MAAARPTDPTARPFNRRATRQRRDRAALLAGLLLWLALLYPSRPAQWRFSAPANAAAFAVEK